MPQSWILDDAPTGEVVITSGADAVHRLRRLAESGPVDAVLYTDDGRVLTITANGKRAMLRLQDDADDPGRHAVSPGAEGESRGFVLSTRQEDVYDDADTVPWETALAAICAIVDGHEPVLDWLQDG